MEPGHWVFTRRPVLMNPGSVGLPRSLGRACWLLIDDSGDEPVVEHRSAGFDAEVVVDALRRRRRPNREFVTSLLMGDGL